MLNILLVQYDNTQQYITPRVMHFSDPRRACAGGLRYLSCVCVCLSVCVSVCYRSSANSARFYAQIINPTVQKLRREKGNMQMSVYLSRPVLAGFEYRACISRYLKAEH